jgi:hypothetical protein
MTTILFHYTHRDDGNWTDRLTAVIDNPNDLPSAEIEQRIRKSLIDGEFFFHADLGLVPSQHANGGDWHEFDRIEETETSNASLFTIEELFERLERFKPVPEVQKIPNSVPIRLAISWLEFLRQTRESLEIITNACKGKKTVMVFNDADWYLLAETLDMDSQSSAFDPNLRKEIRQALDRAATIEVDPLKLLRRKIPLLESRIKRLVRKADA